MNYNLIEIMISILDLFIFNNPIGISSLIIGVVLCILMCKFSKLKTIVICVFSSLLIAIIGLLACTIGNTPDYLWIPIFFFPFVVILAMCFIAKWLLINMKGKNRR